MLGDVQTLHEHSNDALPHYEISPAIDKDISSGLDSRDGSEIGRQIADQKTAR
jgi:hypothetical protein